MSAVGTGDFSLNGAYRIAWQKQARDYILEHYGGADWQRGCLSTDKGPFNSECLLAIAFAWSVFYGEC